MLNIEKRFTYIKDSKELFIIYPSLIGRFWFDVFLRRFLIRHNVSVLEYIFPKSILCANHKEVLDNFLFVKEKTSSDINELKAQYGFERVTVVGVSLGCIYALMVANHRIDLKNLYLILPGHCLAEVLWKGEHTQNIREGLENNKHNLADLKEYWYDLAPENNIDYLKAEKILVFLSEIDKTIPFDHGKELLEKLSSFHYSIEYKSTRYLKHWIAAALFYLKPGKFIKF